MNSNNKSTRLLIVIAVASLVCSVAQAATLYSVPLPSSATDVNGGLLFNNSYSQIQNASYNIIGGDVYNDPSLNQNWTVSMFDVWVIGHDPVDGTSLAPLGYTTATLYGTKYTGGADVVVPVATTTSVTRDVYTLSADGALNYKSSTAGSPGYYDIFRVSFATNISITSGEDYLFAVTMDGVAVPLHVTSSCVLVPNSCQSLGVVGYNGTVSGYTATGFYGMYNAPGSGNADYGDVNAFLTGNATPTVPEPATWVLLGAGIGILGLVRRRRG